jgi:hypothetical protein
VYAQAQIQRLLAGQTMHGPHVGKKHEVCDIFDRENFPQEAGPLVISTTVINCIRPSPK